MQKYNVYEQETPYDECFQRGKTYSSLLGSTVARSEKEAIRNVTYRIFGRSRTDYDEDSYCDACIRHEYVAIAI